MASIGFVSRHSVDLAPLTKVVAGEKAGQLKLDRDVDIKVRWRCLARTCYDNASACRDFMASVYSVNRNNGDFIIIIILYNFNGNVPYSKFYGKECFYFKKSMFTYYYHFYDTSL